MRTRPALSSFAAAALVVAAGCGPATGGDASSPARAVDLTGAGATFPYPIYRQWISAYASRSGTRINYMSVGSAEGMRLLAAGEVDFGAIDREPSAAELGTAACPRLAVPMLVGAVAVVYHLNGVDQPLRLDAAALRAIYDGRVRNWSDAPIARQNPGVRLPALPIAVVHRGAGSATSLAFHAFLHGRATPATTGDPVWRVGVAAEGNEGVAAQVQQTLGAIGYVELAYADQGGLAVALLKNGAGEYARPSAATLNATVARGLAGRPDATGAPLIALPAAGTYPIAAVTWLVLDPGRLSADKGEKVVAFARWALHDGADAARQLQYAPLPPAVVTHYDSALSTLRFTPCVQRP